LPRDLALVYFALGEVRRVRAERLNFRPVPPNFVAVLEQRCEFMLQAQSAYSDVMRAYDAHWSAMAGYRVGELYQRLHADLMQIPAPASAESVSKRQLFEGAMRLRYSILLSKGLAMMDHTLAMAERTGEASVWVSHTRRAKVELERAVRAEQAAIDQLPYRRDDLQRALDRLADGLAPGSP
jgi:hypothetical protein